MKRRPPAAGEDDENDDDQFNLFGDFEHTHARSDDPDTSAGAANATKFRAAKTKLEILRVFYQHGPQTADGIKSYLGRDCHQRISDLWNLDQMISDTGQRLDSERGSSMIVFEINQKGIRKLKDS